MAIASLRVPISDLPKPDISWLDTLSNSAGNAIDTIAQNRAFEQNVIPAITGTPAPQQQPGFLGRLFGGNRIPAPGAQQQVAATNPAPVQGSAAIGTPNDIQNQFINTARAGGLTNPYGLAAVAATGRAESSWDPSKVNAAWPDPSQSGQAGTAGGILSWRNERLANLRNFAQSQGADPSNISPELQAKFFLQEDPALIQRLNAAKSPQEAASIMANAWKFAGYDQPGGEAARRAAMAQNYYSTQFANAQPTAAASAGPTQVASLDPSIGMPMPGAAGEMRATNPAPAASGFDPATATPAQLNAALGPNQAAQPGYVDPVVTTAYRQTPQAAGSAPVNPPVQSVAAPAATAPAAGANPDLIAAAQPASRQNVTNDQIAAMVRNPYTRQVGLQLWQQVLTGKTAQPWSFVKLDDGTLARANQSTGEVQSLGKFASSKKELLSNGKGAFYDSTTNQWITPPPGAAGNSDNYYGTLIKGYDAAGNPAYFQPGKDGSANKVPLPADFKPENRYEKIDLGTSWLIKDTTNGTSQEIPKDVQGESRDKASGTAQAAAQTALPAVEGAANQILSSIDSLANDPYLPKMLGKSSYLPNVTTDSQRVQSKMDQITGQTFLQAYNTLRGAGQITEVEGQKATAAMGRLNTAQSEKDYRDALNDLRGVVQNAVQRARQQAGQSVAPQATVPASNTTSSGVKWSIEQ
ncbi:phage tail tip lysozyme [Rhizobium sp. WW22]|uniref:phage tail tip lysozyme n=1 Tax=Rhizobium sp. WW22 TaxID=3389070 RepID=UPI000DD6D27C